MLPQLLFVPEILYLLIQKELRTRGLFRKLPDKVLIDGIRNQDDKILNYLYDNYYHTVKNHVLANSGVKDDVPDVFQEAIIVLYQKICSDNLTLTSDLKGYFFGIARNIWSAQLRARRKTEELKSDMPDDHDDEHDILFSSIMARAFSKLKPDCQELLKLYYDGCSYEEIAERLDLKSEAYCRRKKYLCKEALMEIIKEDPEYIEYQRFLR